MNKSIHLIRDHVRFPECISTIADFITSMEKEIVDLFLEIFLVCDERGLIDKEMFAFDGCKMPSNASKEWRGTRKDFKRKAGWMGKR